MKIAICIAAVAALVGTCFRAKMPGPASANENVIEYQVQENKYVIVVARSDGMSEAQARQLARQRAAEITVMHGQRFFSIQSETNTRMVKTDEQWPNNNAYYGNLYQELIVEGDFSKEPGPGQSPEPAQVVPATRFVIVIYSNSGGPGSIDACKYTECNQ